jgi:NAD(P)H-flavin reductase
VQQIKEEELNIIYQIQQKGDKRVLLGFYGNYAYIWNQNQQLQIFSVDTKGGNRPIRLALKSNVANQAFGKIFILAYAMADKIYIHDTMWQLED